MKCNQARALLSLYLDGELEPSREELLSAHLKICPGCSREMDELKQAVEMLRGLPELVPTAGFRAGLRERLAEEQLSAPVGYRPRDSFARRGARLWPRVAVAATLLLAVGITSLWYGLAGPNRDIGAGVMEQLSSSFVGQDKNIRDKDTRSEETKDDGARNGANDLTVPPEIEDNASETGTAPEPETKTPPAGSAERKDVQEDGLPTGTPSPEETKEAPEATGGPAADGQAPQVFSGGGGSATSLAPGGFGRDSSLQANPVSVKILRQDIEIETGNFAKLTPLVSPYIPSQERAAFTDSGPQAGRLEVKVPAEQAPALLQKIKAQVGIIRQEEKETDVTADYLGLVKRLQQLEEKEKQLQAGSESLPDAAIKKSISEGELNTIQGEMQAVRAKLKDMEEESNTVVMQIILK